MKDNVLRNKKDFSNLFKNKSTYYSSFFIIYAYKNNLGWLRYAIAANKKNFKTAVERNKIKRQIRSIVRGLENKNIPADILIIPKNNFFKTDFLNKKNDLINLIVKIHLNIK